VAPRPPPALALRPSLVADYIHTVLEADRTAYTRHVVNRAKMLEGKAKADGVVPVEATEAWQQGRRHSPTGPDVPLRAQKLPTRKGYFTYNLISPWYINDSHAP
jgi:hypothetical protein